MLTDIQVHGSQPRTMLRPIDKTKSLRYDIFHHLHSISDILIEGSVSRTLCELVTTAMSYIV